MRWYGHKVNEMLSNIYVFLLSKSYQQRNYKMNEMSKDLLRYLQMKGHLGM